MSYIEFDKNQLINLKYSLSKEVIRSSRAGTYASTTIIHCNTRKYHGLLICPLSEFDGQNHVLLSTVHETIVQREKEFNLGIHKYPGQFHPLGHKYIQDFTTEPIPKITYRVGGVVLEKELMLLRDQEQMLIRYTLKDAHSPTKLQIKPFLAFRNVHVLGRANFEANTKVIQIENGVKAKLYEGYPYLNMQISKEMTFTSAPDWFYNIEYQEEQKRGYDYQEDLFMPGFFEMTIEKGETIIFSASLKEFPSNLLNERFENETKDRIPRNSFENCLENSAQQFFVKKDNKMYVIAGFPWFGPWSRDTFIALPGLTLPFKDFKTCKAVLDTMTEEAQGALFKNDGINSFADVNSVDAPLWYFWTIQQYIKYSGNQKEAWENYGSKMKEILEGYRNGLQYNIKMHDNGLIWAGKEGKALTWMDAFAYGRAVTPRIGYAVEVNALWYNAVMFTLELAQQFGDSNFVNEWTPIAQQIPANFTNIFYNSEKKQLADYVDNKGQNLAVRPNQIFATSLPYTPISEEIKNDVLVIVKSHLLTSKGLRSLSPRNLAYVGAYEGNQNERDAAYHQGTVWPWLMGHYVEGSLKLYGKSFIGTARKIYKEFENEMSNAGIGTISEIYDGDPPHEARGTISQAWSVAEIIRIKVLIDEFENKKI